jgi:hypothetical protein
VSVPAPAPDPNAAFARAAAAISSAGRSVPAEPAAPTAAARGLGRESTLNEAAEALASDLRSVPGIGRFGGMRLAELERTGPRPLRTMWRIAKDRLDDRYGQLTIGEIIDRYTGQGGTSPRA